MEKESTMKQGLEKSPGLSKTQLVQISQLEAICNQFEGLAMKMNWSRLQNRSSNEINDFLYYDDDKLVGYLALYIFNSREAETMAVTHPEYRRRGIFKQLLAEARGELIKRNVPSLLFINEQASSSGAECMKAIGANYEFSEYKMILRQALKVNQRPELQLRLARPDDLADLARMEEICFDLPLEDTRQHLEKDMADRRRRILVAMLGTEKIGKIHMLIGEETYISAFCVLPQYRGQGYGKTILSQAVEQLAAEDHHNISLEVESKNRNALSLYERCGFQIVTAYDYFRLPVKTE